MISPNDEPASNLAPETSEGIFKILKNLSQEGRAVIMATHNYGLLKKYNSRTFKCEDGKLIEAPMVEEIDFSSLG